MATPLTTISEERSSKPPIASTSYFFQYIVIAFGLTWMLLGLAVLIGHGIIALPIPATVLITLGTLGPTWAAICAVAGESGHTGIFRSGSFLGRALSSSRLACLR